MNVNICVIGFTYDMVEFPVVFQLREFEIAFTIQCKDELDLNLECFLKGYQLCSSFLSLQILNDMFSKGIANLNFSLQSLQLQVIIPIGKIKKYIYLPVCQEDSQKIRFFLARSMQQLQQSLNAVKVNGSKEMSDIMNETQKQSELYEDYRESLCQKKRSIRTYEQQIASLNEEDLKLNRQILVIDEEIMSCKRGLQLQQYRMETSSENRQERKKKVYLTELSKLINPRIQKIIRDPNQNTTRLDLGQCQLKFMKFVEIFERIQELKLPKNSIRKIQGLNNLVYLRKLDLQANMIERIQGLNNNLEIREIKLQRNRIVRLENIFHLCRLQILALSQNMMEDIPKEIKMLEGLVELRLINNNINHIPWEIINLNKLRIFFICNDCHNEAGNPCSKENHKAKDLLKKLVSAQVDIGCTAV